MKPKKATPGGERKARGAQFSNVKVKAGLASAFNAWMAAEVYWCEAHRHTDEDPGTKICLDWATDGELHCPRCKKYPVTELIAYCCFWREEDSHPGMVLCHEVAHEMLAELRYGVYVLIGRVTWDSSIYVKRSEPQRRFATTDEGKKSAADIFPTLLQCWGYAQYDKWLHQKGMAQKIAANGSIIPPPVAQRLSVPPPTTTVEALAIDAHRNDSVFGGTVDEVTEKLKARVKDAQKNGKHKPDGEGE